MGFNVLFLKKVSVSSQTGTRSAQAKMARVQENIRELVK